MLSTLRENSNNSGHIDKTYISPFTKRVMRVKVLSRFKLPPQLGFYEGKTNQMDHLDIYKNLMMLQGASNEVMCKVFSVTLKGSARS